MPDKKLTDNEIVKALECRKSDTALCTECPYYKTGECIEKMCADSIDLINRQKAENERLKESLNIELENFATEYDNKIKAEAYKEFAERLKEQAEVYTDSAEDVFILAVGISKIDNLLKELMGENND